MKKLKLNLDEIKVESFETIQSMSNKGTIWGQISGAALTCEECPSLVATCTCPTDTTCPTVPVSCGCQTIDYGCPPGTDWFSCLNDTCYQWCSDPQFCGGTDWCPSRTGECPPTMVVNNC